ECAGYTDETAPEERKRAVATAVHQKPTGTVIQLGFQEPSLRGGALLEGAEQLDRRQANALLLEGAKNGRLDSVQRALYAGADIECCDKDGHTSVKWASANGHVEVLQYLVDKGANSNAPHRSGVTALMNALRQNIPQVACAEVLLDAG